MPNAWVMHVKDYAQSHNMKYAHAVTDEECRKTYYAKKEKMPPSEKKSHHKKKPNPFPAIPEDSSPSDEHK